MRLRGVDPRHQFVSFGHDARGSALFVLVAGDYGVVECELRPSGLEKVRTLPCGPVALAERDPLNGAIAVVGAGARPDHNPRRVCVYAGEPLAVVASKHFKLPVLSLAFSCRGHLAVCLSDRIYWYKFLERDDAPKEVPTCPNPKGMFALSEDGLLLAYPESPTVVAVAHAVRNGFDAHARIDLSAGPVCRLRFNRRNAGEDLLAAAAEGGKTVWVYALPRVDGAGGKRTSGAELRFEFTRSRTKQCHVYGLDFNAFSTLLALSADSGTVHVFELSPRNAVASQTSYLSNLTAWIPSVVAPTVQSKFKVRVTEPRCHALACLAVRETLPGEDEALAQRNVCVLTSAGSLLEYALPPDAPGVHETAMPLRTMSYLF